MTTTETESPALTPTQYLIVEVLTARARLGEPFWTFPSNITTTVRVLEKLGYVNFKSAPTYGHIQVWFTNKGAAEFLDFDYHAPILKQYQDLLHSIWLYINWRHVTRQLTTVQKELFADSVDAASKRENEDGFEPWKPVADRWWTW